MPDAGLGSRAHERAPHDGLARRMGPRRSHLARWRRLPRALARRFVGGALFLTVSLALAILLSINFARCLDLDPAIQRH
jgi:hypothetical protein